MLNRYIPKNLQNFRISFLRFSLMAGTACILAACGTSQEQNAARVDAALERASLQAAAQGQERESLALVERLYQRRSEEPGIALRYARALRQHGHLNEASIVLGPFMDRDDLEDVFALQLKEEMANVQLNQGNYSNAEELAKSIIDKNEAFFPAYHLLGIALDAQGKHEKAEIAFRKGLDMWQGNPLPIMNNLALNLINQQYLDEAVEILNKASALDPDNLEVEKNRRIALALQQSTKWKSPKPTKKPIKLGQVEE